MQKVCEQCRFLFNTDSSRRKFCSRKCFSENYKQNFSGANSQNYGVKKSQIARERIRLAKLGEKNPMFGKSAWNKGMPWPDHIKLKVSKTKKELLEKGIIKPWNKGIKTNQKVWNKGKKVSEDARMAELTKKASKTRLERMKDPNYRERFKSRSSTSHKKYYEQHPEALIKLKEVRSKIIYPKKDTSIEIKLQNSLRNLGIKFSAHYPFYNSKCETRMDIALPEQKVAVYCDGDYWHNLPSYKIRDARITSELERAGWKVLRFWEHEINSNAEACAVKVFNVINNGQTRSN